MKTKCKFPDKNVENEHKMLDSVYRISTIRIVLTLSTVKITQQASFTAYLFISNYL